MSSLRAQPEKPKVQPREVARKAVKEIKKTPPKLFLYSIAGAIAVIVLVVGLIAFRIHSENSEDEGSAAAPAATAPVGRREAGVEPGSAARDGPAPAQPEQVTVGQEAPVVSVVPKYGKNKKKAKAQPVASATVIPGQLNINSTPEGAEVRIDGRSDPSWVTPFNLAGLSPGQHSVTVARAGYAPESRTIDVASGSKSISGDPAGADYGRGCGQQSARGSADFHRRQRYRERDSGADLRGQAGSTYLPGQEAGLSGAKLPAPTCKPARSSISRPRSKLWARPMTSSSAENSRNCSAAETPQAWVR